MIGTLHSKSLYFLGERLVHKDLYKVVEIIVTQRCDAAAL